MPHHQEYSLHGKFSYSLVGHIFHGRRIHTRIRGQESAGRQARMWNLSELFFPSATSMILALVLNLRTSYIYSLFVSIKLKLDQHRTLLSRLCTAMGGAEKAEIEYGSHSLSNRAEEAVQAIVEFIKRDGPKGWDDPWSWCGAFQTMRLKLDFSTSIVRSTCLDRQSLITPYFAKFFIQMSVH